MKVLYITYDGLTDVLGRSQVIPYLLGLSGLGHEIHVISFEKKHNSVSDKNEVTQLLETANIQWSSLTFRTSPPWISKFYDIVQIRRKSKHLHLENQFDIVHCRSYIAALAGLDLKIKYNIRFVFDMRGFWANERIEGYIWNLDNPVYRIIYHYFKKKEKLFFRYADAVISLTYNGKQVIRELFGKSVHDKTTVIPCCVDTNLFSMDGIDHSLLLQFRKEMNIGDKDFVISYLGSTGTWYMTGEMMLFFKRLQNKYAHAKFLFITTDDEHALKKKSAEYGISDDSMRVVAAQRKDVPKYLALSQVSIFFIRPVFSKKASSPTKQAEILSMGIPLICNAGVGDTDSIMADEKAGIVIKDFSDKEFDHAIQKIDHLLSLDREQIRQKALDSFNLKTGIDTYHGIYQSFAEKH
ncbi:MAG: glycosyltransferase [Bacteroidota bacterium]